MGTKVYDNALDLITFSRASGGTYLGSDGLLKTASTNVPRIEYAADGTVKGLLIEEQRTNLLPYSSEFDNAAWDSSTASVTANAAVAPDGTSTAYEFESTSTTYSSVFDTITTVTSTTYTGSVYAKAGTVSSLGLEIRGSSTTPDTIFDLSTGTITSGVGTIEDAGNGWYRCSITKTAVDNSELFIIGRGASGASGDTIYIWGAQFEAGSFATSYISTSGSAATRSADIASIPVSAFGYNQKAGTLFVEVLTPEVDQILAGPAYFNTTAFQNSRGFSKANASNAASGGRYVFGAYDGASTTLDIADANTGAFVKLAASYGGAESAVANGGAVSTGTARNPSPSNLRIGGRDTGNQSQCWIKSIQYLPRRLTNTQLQELTA